MNNKTNIISNKCNNCFSTCKPLYCRGCYKVSYCSQACQKAHWKSGHKNICTRSSTSKSNPLLQQQQSNIKEEKKEDSLKNKDLKAYNALLELKSTMDKLSLKEVHDNNNRIQNDIKTLQIEVEDNNRNHWFNLNNEVINNKNNKNTSSSSCTQQQDQEEKNDIIVTSINDNNNNNKPMNKNAWPYTIEILSNISCYRITLVRQLFLPMLCNQYTNDTIQYTIHNTINKHKDAICNIQVYIQQEENIILFNGNIPGELIDSTGRLSIEPDCIVLRIQYNKHSFNLDYDDVTNDYITKLSPSLTITSANNIKCKSCRKTTSNPNVSSTILKSNNSIHKILDLPIHDWMEVYDYISCYQTDNMSNVLNFQNQNNYYNQQGIVWDSMQYLTYNSHDISLDCIVIRGDTEDLEYLSKGVYCSNCQCLLGFTTVHQNNDSSDVTTIANTTTTTISFYKHCVTSSNHNAHTTESIMQNDYNNIFYNHTFATHVANEMIQYADSNGIFSFIIQQQPPIDESSNDSDHCTIINDDAKIKRNNNKHVLLHLLSWDTAFSIKHQKGQQQYDTITFHKYIKVAFQIRSTTNITTLEQQQRHGYNSSSLPCYDMTCCPPPIPIPQQQKQHVISCNNSMDWEQLIVTLQNGIHYFPKSIAQATLSIIPGFNNQNNDSSNTGIGTGKEKNVVSMNEPKSSSSGISIIPLL